MVPWNVYFVCLGAMEDVAFCTTLPMRVLSMIFVAAVFNGPGPKYKKTATVPRKQTSPKTAKKFHKNFKALVMKLEISSSF
jgi:hypothetical protein